MGVKFLSGFRGIDNAKQQLRRSTHLGSDLTSGGTVLSPSQGFDPQVVFVYLNGALLQEGGTAPGDYTITNNSTITFNSAVSATDDIEVVSYNFVNPTLPHTMIEKDHTVTTAEANRHNTSVTGASFDHTTNVLSKTGGFTNSAVDDVINVTASPTANSLAVGRYRIKTKTNDDSVVLQSIDNADLSFTATGTSNINFTDVFSLQVQNLTFQNRALVFYQGLLLVENTDFFKDVQTITFAASVNITDQSQIAIRHFGSFVFPTSSEIGNNGIVIQDDISQILITNTDVGASNISSTFKIVITARHQTETDDSYRATQIVVRAEKNDASQCYIHRVWDVGNIGADMQVLDSGNYSSYTSVTDGKLGVAVHADANNWFVYLVNRSGHPIVAGFKASAITG